MKWPAAKVGVESTWPCPAVGNHGAPLGGGCCGRAGGGRAASCGKAQGSVHARHQRPSVKCLRLMRGVQVGLKKKECR